MRTTVDIDDPILQEVRSLQRKAGASLGRVISDLLAQGLRAHRDAVQPARKRRRWIARDLRPRVDLADKDAVQAVLDGPGELNRKVRR